MKSKHWLILYFVIAIFLIIYDAFSDYYWIEKIFGLILAVIMVSIIGLWPILSAYKLSKKSEHKVITTYTKKCSTYALASILINFLTFSLIERLECGFDGWCGINVMISTIIVIILLIVSFLIGTTILLLQRKKDKAT